MRAKIPTPLILLYYIITVGPNWQGVQIMNLLNISLSKASYQFLTLKSKG